MGLLTGHTLAGKVKFQLWNSQKPETQDITWKALAGFGCKAGLGITVTSQLLAVSWLYP